MNTRDDLQELLTEGIAGAKDREQNTFHELAGSKGVPLVLFGAGGLGQRTLAGLRRHGLEPVAFADNNSANWGRTVDGVPVMSPVEAASQYGDTAVFVVTVWGALGKDRMRDRIAQLTQLGCRRVISFGPLYWRYPEGLMPHYGADLPHKVHEQSVEVLAAFDLWSDDASRREYLSQIRWRLQFDFDALAEPVAHTMYFPTDLCPLLPDEVFVDCGAFDGDSVELFLKASSANFRKIIAIEPDPKNFARLRENAEKIPGAIQTIHAATGAHPGKVRLIAEGSKSSAIGSGDVEVDCVALDDVIGTPPPTYIKMDIEGAEIDTLLGASRIIRDHSPVLAICCYHRQDHLWKIPLLIHSLNPGYRFFLRPHDLEMWDLVCYAIPKARLNRS